MKRGVDSEEDGRRGGYPIPCLDKMTFKMVNRFDKMLPAAERERLGGFGCWIMI